LNPQVGPKVLLYAAAAVVIVHDATTSDQYFYDGHNDDITCVAVSSDGHMAASGQVGRSPEVI
jgi:microtubule-associated protein-like 6